MKLYLKLVFALFLISASLNAQHVAIGIKGGLNLYNISNSISTSYDTKAGLHLGLLWHMHLAPHFALQPEIVYSAQGTKYILNGTKTSINLNYINVPILFQHMFGNGFRLEAGPQLGFLLSAKSETNSSSVSVYDDYKAVDFGLGLGLSIISPRSGLGLDFRYNIGLSDINKNGSIKSTNNGFQLGLFIQFRH